ncbi:MAG: RhuM family protein [bacterium]|nr:RhuM family protein [bacterium]
MRETTLGEKHNAKFKYFDVHVRNIFQEGELDKNSVWAKFAYTASDGKEYEVDFYNLNVIISVGYRVKSLRGTQFRTWAMGILKEYMK